MPRPKQTYEFTVILRVTLGDEGIAAAVDKFKTLISDNGEIESVDEWGKRRLAYEIDDETEGYYVHIVFVSGAEFPAELDRICNISDSVLRNLTICRE